MLKRCKRQIKIDNTSSTPLQEVQRQRNQPRSHLAYSDSGGLWMSCGTAAPIPLDEPDTYLSCGSLKKKQANYFQSQDVNCLDQNIRNGQNKYTKQSFKKDAQQVNVKTTKQADDETLLNVIESADLDQAIQLLKGNNHFSQDGLDKALISACHRGLKFLVQELVCLGANVQFKDTLGNTPLLICIESGFVDIVRFLLKKKADVNASNSVGDTALILSIRPAGSLEMVRVLLDQSGIDISHQNRDGYTALMKAVEVRDVDVIKILMDRYTKEDLDGTTSRQVCKSYCLGPIEVINSKGMSAEGIADKCGLGNIYNLLKTHKRKRVSLLEMAKEEHDTESLEILLDCHFVEKHDICKSFMQIFKTDNLGEGKTLTKKEIVIIKRILKCGAAVDTSWYGGSTALSVAVNMGDYDLVELLCQHLDQQHQLRSRGVLKALKAAAKSGRCDLINLLIKYKADIIHRGNYRASPLDCAIRHGHLDSAKLLVQHGAKMDINYALYIAVDRQLPKYLNFVFENNKKRVIKHVLKCDHENHILLSAARIGNLEVIGRLLDAGADINRVNTFGKTPLGVAKNRDVAKLLIRRGADVNNPLPYGYTVLIQTLSTIVYDSSKLEVVKVLLKNGASVNKGGRNGKTPIMVAASEAIRETILQTLLDYGADINGRDKEGNTTLMEAVCNNRPAMVLFLLNFHKEKNLCLNVQNHAGQTAVMYAVIYKNIQVLQQLINFGADVNIPDVYGNTPLMQAVKTPFHIVTALITAGSDVNCQNNGGMSALMLAAAYCRIDAIELLLDSGAEVNAVSKSNSAQTALSFISDIPGDIETFVRGIRVLLRNGASSSYIKSELIYRMILGGEINLVLELIRCGLGPADVMSENVIRDTVDSKDIPTVSPLCIALLIGNVSLAHYFVGHLFMTNSDITSLTGNKILRHVLERRQQEDCMNFLNELSSKPLSLYQLAFVTVSSAVGSSPGRESRVNMLPLPQAMKDKLSFTSFSFSL